MKFGMKDDDKGLDIENLDAIIKRCEEAMGKRFKKEAPPEAPGEEPEDAPEESSESDIGEGDIDDLLRMYSELKNKK